MENKIMFENKTKEELAEFIKKSKNRKIFNFLNAHCIYFSKKESLSDKSLKNKNVMNLIDGMPVCLYLSIKNFKKVPRTRGPSFTRYFLENSKYSGNKKHFFIGLEVKDLQKLKKKLPHLKNSFCYNPPYIKKISFDNKEINKIARKINENKIDFVWVGVGNPKQEILSMQLFNKTKAKHFFNIGAALDFVLDKKREAPLVFREAGMEWAYRFITDFKYSRKKVLRSFIATRYLNTISLKK